MMDLRRHFLALTAAVICALCSTHAFATASVAQEFSFISNTAATTAAVTIASSTAGDTLEIVAQSNGAVVSGVADTQGNTWTVIGSVVTGGTSARTFYHYYAPNIVGGADTITVTYSFSINGLGVTGKELAGVTASPLDSFAAADQTAPGTSTNGVSSGTATNTNQPALISAFTFNSANATQVPTAGTGFTLGQSGALTTIGSAYATESEAISSTTAVAATFTAAGNVEHNTLMAIWDASVTTTTLHTRTLTGAGN